MRILRLLWVRLLRILRLDRRLLRILWLGILLLRILRLPILLLRILRLLVLWLRVGLLWILGRVRVRHLAGDRLRLPASSSGSGDQGCGTKQAQNSFNNPYDAGNSENYPDDSKVRVIIISAGKKSSPGYKCPDWDEYNARDELGQWSASSENRTEEDTKDPVQVSYLH